MLERRSEGGHIFTDSHPHADRVVVSARDFGRVGEVRVGGLLGRGFFAIDRAPSVGACACTSARRARFSQASFPFYLQQTAAQVLL